VYYNQNVCNLLYDIDVFVQCRPLAGVHICAILICVLLAVFDIMRHNKPAVVHSIASL